MKKRVSSKLKSIISLLLVSIIAFQSASLIGFSRQAVASTSPQGETKLVLVRYRGELAAGEEAPEKIAELRRRQQWIANSLQHKEGYKKVVLTYSQLPFVAMEVDGQGEASLRQDPNILSITEDRILEPVALPFTTTPGNLGGNFQTGFSDGQNDFTGEGFAVAVLDSGVDKNHPYLENTVISEACFGINQEFSNATVASVCPGGATQSTAVGSGMPCAGDGINCTHGTMVASMIAMQPTDGLSTGGDAIEAAGIAQDAKLIAIQTNMEVTEKTGQPDICGNAGSQTETCFRPLLSLLLAGLNRVLELQNDPSFTVPIAAANVSIGDPAFFTDEAAACNAHDTLNIRTVIAGLKAANVATVVAAGNSGDTLANANEITYPACLENAIAISASTASDTMTTYTNSGPLTDLLAPGGEIDPDAPSPDGGIFAATPGDNLPDQFDITQGTSFSAPMVAGAWAVIRERAPQASVDGILQGFQEAGVSVVEARSGYTSLTHQRINIGAALAAADSFSTTQPPPPSGSGSSNTPSNRSTDFIPGVPSTGLRERIIHPVLQIGLACLGLLLIHRRTLQRLIGHP